jgi:NADH-quinone oxidoreductase subunit M
MGLLIILFLPERRKQEIKWISAICSGITLALSLYLFFAYDKSLGGLQFVEKFLWVKSLGITYFNGADGFNLPNLLLTGIVFFAGVLTMWEMQTLFAGDRRVRALYEHGSIFYFCLV